MLTLRLTQSTEGRNRYRVEAALEGDGLSGRVATARFDFKLTAQDQEDMRWYLEDFLQYPLDPAPIIAARIESRMEAIGTELFKGVFQSNDDVRDLWTTLRTRLNDTRLEIVTEAQEATVVPWELIRDPKTDAPLALRASAFVRAHQHAGQRRREPTELYSRPIRILLAICRPGGSDDVPFRSVASRLIKGLSDDTRALFQLEVLRPPTFSQLARALLQAEGSGKPYHVVHFDGHGIYEDLDARYSGQAPKNMRGYLVFENADIPGNQEFVHGALLGKALADASVRFLVLNACRSAHAEPKVEPEESATDYEPRAFGSLAQETMDAGVAGVVAMRYNVYMVTAAQFIGGLYAALAQGHSLGRAATLGRKQLADNPLREIAFAARPLQDWCVPVVYEDAPVSLVSQAYKEETQYITVSAGEVAHARQELDPNQPPSPSAGSSTSSPPAMLTELDPNQPPSPSAGFFGRDETLLAIDRAFDRHSIVLLHAYAGSGKTTTAAEFAHWYALTGGVNGPTLFTSFAQHTPLARVLDQMEVALADKLRQGGVNWLTLSDEERRSTALKIFEQFPALWIWDNVEPIAGFSARTESAWSAAEQKELVDFLGAASKTKVKFLLTSRRAERSWLGNLPARIELPPMPFQERVQFARALAEQHGRHLPDIEDWRPLLRFTQGNPLTILVLVGQVLRDGLETKAQMLAFVEKLRAGETAFEDETFESRSKALSASLSYGFERGFTDHERRQLALLHFFEGYVNVNLLKWMTGPSADWFASELRGLSLDLWSALLDRAAEVGLVESHGGGYYSIHPVLPWFFGRLFDGYYPARGTGQSGIANPRLAATMAFVKTVASWGNALHDTYGKGDSDSIKMLKAEESNLLSANRLARAHGWQREVIATMQGLDVLYSHTGRSAQWARLVNDIVPDFVDPDTDGPLPGAEDLWGFVFRYRIGLAEKGRNWLDAERLLLRNATWNRQQARTVLGVPTKQLDEEQLNSIRTLAGSLNELGNVQIELRKPECLEALRESFALLQQIGVPEAAVCAHNIGNAYASIPSLRDLAEAERWYRLGLDLCDEDDQQGVVRGVAQLASVAYERFKDAVSDGLPKEEQLQHLNVARRVYELALQLLPPDDVIRLSAVHKKLGDIYTVGSDPNVALSHYLEALRYGEALGDLYSSAITRSSIAITLMQMNRFADALDYANAAARNYEMYGERATEERSKLEGLIADIKRQLEKGGG